MFYQPSTTKSNESRLMQGVEFGRGVGAWSGLFNEALIHGLADCPEFPDFNGSRCLSMRGG